LYVLKTDKLFSLIKTKVNNNNNNNKTYYWTQGSKKIPVPVEMGFKPNESLQVLKRQK
jgi:hypothetical protein